MIPKRSRADCNQENHLPIKMMDIKVFDDINHQVCNGGQPRLVEFQVNFAGLVN